MALWSRLYNTIWLVFFTSVALPRWLGPKLGAALHILLGLGVLAMTFGNAGKLAALSVPARLQRISKVTFKLAAFQAVCGLALGAVTHLAPNLPVVGSVLHGAHIVVALAILAQAASVATGHDMWEEKELGGAPPSSNAS